MTSPSLAISARNLTLTLGSNAAPIALKAVEAKLPRIGKLVHDDGPKVSAPTSKDALIADTAL
ncbi:MAG: ABC transporter, partial [Erythrobacteraceae bacterium]